MPSGYAHLRLGTGSLPYLPKDVSLLNQRFRQLFEVGLQGPDPLFYYNPVFHTEIGALAGHFHKQSGKEFFGNALKKYSLAPSDGARAYLYGLLGHYCLDSLCHPYVKAVAAEGKIGHMEMEIEFDRFLMEKDGIAEPWRYNMRPHYRLTGGACVTAAQFLEPATPAVINRSMHNMARINWLASRKNRKLVGVLMGFGGKVGKEMLMRREINENCVGTSGALLALYEEAAERYPVFTEQLYRAIHNGEALGSDFEPCFG